MNGWPTKRLGELLSFLTSGSRGWAEHYRESGDLFLRIQNVGRNRMLLDDVAYVAAPETAEARRTLVQSGDVLLSITADLGRTGVVPDGIGRAFINQHLAILRVQNIHPPFLSAYLASPEGQKQVMGRNKHAVKAGLNFEDIRSFQIPLPPLAEQRRIAEVLDRAEALRAKRRAALAQLDSLTQSLFLDLFGDPANNPRGWPRVPFSELGENQDSQRVPVKSSDRDGREGKYPYYGASGIIDWVDDFIYEGERLLVGEDGANLIARATPVAYIARGKYWVNNHAHVIAENGRADLRFLEFFIEHLDLKPYISGTAQPKLNRSNLDRISVPLPPLPLQREFARRVAAVEKLKAAQRPSLAELDALFASLQHRAFRGEL